MKAPRRLGDAGHALPWTVLMAAAALHQLFLLSNGDMRLFGPESLDGTFNSMLLHLLRGDADVSPAAIGFESFSRDGHTYTYFGIVPALLRLPAVLLVPGFETAHLARLSCLAAGLCHAGIILRTLLAAHRALPEEQRDAWLLRCAAIACVFSGTPAMMLTAGYVYSEPVLWSAALVAGFNLVVVQAALARRRLHGSELCLLALLAGLALNTRPSGGMDLLAGFAMVLSGHAWSMLRGRHQHAIRPPVGWGQLILAGTVMATGLLVVGAVNQARWGSPFTFLDLTQQDILRRYPARMAQLVRNGAFNLRRIPVSLAYYATGLPYVLKHHGAAGAYLDRLYDVIEGPPSSPLLTAPLWVLLAAAGLRRTLRQGLAVLSALAGHAVVLPILLTAMTLTLRYRADLAGLLMLPAFFGYGPVSAWLSRQDAVARRRAKAGLAGLVCLGIAGTHGVLLMSKILTPAVPVAVRCALQPAAPFIPVNMATSLPAGCWGDASR